MSIGSMLVGIAVVLSVGAYLARPFRKAKLDLDRAIEAWVAQVRTRGQQEEKLPAGEPANYCPQCGRRVRPDDRFCSGCGMQLQEASE